MQRLIWSRNASEVPFQFPCSLFHAQQNMEGAGRLLVAVVDVGRQPPRLHTIAATYTNLNSHHSRVVGCPPSRRAGSAD